MKCLCFILALSVACCAVADDSNWSAFGSAGNFTKSKSVTMLRETVRMELDNDGVDVQATFWFKNLGPKRVVKMGFPDDTSTNNVDFKSLRQRNVIRWFKSWVDGKPIAVKRVLLSKKHMDYNCAWVKSVPFDKGQTRKVEVHYFASHGFAGNGWIYDTYVLETGSTWAGKIGSGVVTLDWSRMSGHSMPEIVAGPGMKVSLDSATHATVTFHNLKPKDNVDVEMVTGFFNFTMNGKHMDIGRGLPDESGGPVLSGTPQDLVIPVDNLSNFFAERRDGTNEDWKSPEAKHFGGKLELPGGRKLVLGTGAVKTLRRPMWTKNDASFIYLKDLIEALGEPTDTTSSGSEST